MAIAAHDVPFLRWDGVHLVLHLGPVETHLREILEHPGVIEDLRLSGAGDTVRVEGVVTWRGLRTHLIVELAELRLRSRYLGFRVRRVRAAGSVPMPRRAVLAMFRRRFPALVSVFPDDGIAILDLARWLPAEFSLRVLTIQVVDRFLHIWVGAGSLHDLPGSRRRALPSEAARPLPSPDS